MLFVDDLSFIASEMSVKKIAKLLRKVGNLIVEWEQKNVVTYNMAKTKQCLNL